MTINLHQQLECAHRELSRRLAVYPLAVNKGIYTPAQSNKEIQEQRAIVKTLEDLCDGIEPRRAVTFDQFGVRQ